MSFFDQPIKLTDLPESEVSYDLLPAGWYTARIGDVVLKDTKSGTGQFLAITYDVVWPSHQGRKVFGNLNIRNANAEAERIGRQQLGELMRASGMSELRQTDDLINRQCQIKVTIKPADGQYEARNEVKGFKAADGMGSAFPSKPQQASSDAPKPARAAAPWAK
jgi:hypothetical protein